MKNQHVHALNITTQLKINLVNNVVINVKAVNQVLKIAVLVLMHLKEPQFQVVIVKMVILMKV